MNEKEIKWKTEYRVRPVTRYVVTKYTYAEFGHAGSENCGEFQNVGNANRTCHALAVSHLNEGEDGECEVYYKLYSHEYDETEYENNGLIRVSSSR